MHPQILIVDDEPNIRHSLMRLFDSEGFQAIPASDSESALEVLREQAIDVIISDERLSGMSGVEFLSLVHQEYPETIRIILTSQANVESAIRAITAGEISRYLLKPWKDEELQAAILDGLERRSGPSDQLAALRNTQRKRLIIEELEKDYPGIGKVDRDPDGSIIL
jgi:two-component system, probable response regulator PhcQ